MGQRGQGARVEAEMPVRELAVAVTMRNEAPAGK